MSEDTNVALMGQIEALEGWRKQMLALQEAADNKLRPLLESVPGALGRHVYEVAAGEIERLRGALGKALYFNEGMCHAEHCPAGPLADSDDGECACNVGQQWAVLNDALHGRG